MPRAVEGDEPRILQRKVKLAGYELEKGEGKGKARRLADSVVVTTSASDVD